MKPLLSYATTAGTFYIAESNGRFFPVFEGEQLGAYGTAQQAIDDLVSRYGFLGGIDSNNLGIPSNPADWQQA